MIRGSVLFLIITAILAVPAPVAAQTVEAGPVKLKLNGRIQTQFNTTSIDGDDVGSGDEIPFSTFETRRVRFGVTVQVEDWITGKLEPDFALGRLSLKDAWVNLAFDPRFQLRVGQFKKPFSLMELTSGTTVAPIERGVRIRGLDDELLAFGPGQRSWAELDGTPLLGGEYDLLDRMGYLGRDIGAAVHGRFGRFGYEVGFFNGNGPDARDDTSEKSVAGRLTYRPNDAWPLTLGADVSHREFRGSGEVDGVHVDDRELDGTVFGIDAEWGAFRRPGLRLLAEAVTGSNILTDATLFGAQAIASTFLPLRGDRLEGVEPLLRLSYGDPDTGTEDDQAFFLTPGVNLYFLGRNRLMFNWDVFLPGDDRVGTAHAFRAQAQVVF